MGIIKKVFGSSKNGSSKKSGMGLFGDSSSPFDDVLEKVTAEHLTTENWAMILDICDKVNMDPKAPKLVLQSIRKRLNHRDPHVIILALSVLDSCWSNCGPALRKEVSSSSFVSELTAKATYSVRPVAEKTRLMIKNWAEAECKTDPSLSLIVSMYRNLQADGYSFDTSEPKKKTVVSNDPNVVSTQEEEDAIAKAIQLSLQDSQKPAKTGSLYPSNMTSKSNGCNSNGNTAAQTNGSSAKSMYPSLSVSMQPKSILKKVQFVPDNWNGGQDSELSPSPVPSSITMAPSESALVHSMTTNNIYPHAFETNPIGANGGVTPERTVRALYDFEAAEGNEISFVTGDLITVTDDSNQNWWSGRIGVQQGLFPASFVTSDLSEVKPETSTASSEVVPAANIDESVLLKCIQLLEDCDPTGETPDSPELAQTEAAAMAQVPLIDARLAGIDRQSNALAQVDIAIRDVLALYDQAVQQGNPYQSGMYQAQHATAAPQMSAHGPTHPQTYPYPNQVPTQSGMQGGQHYQQYNQQHHVGPESQQQQQHQYAVPQQQYHNYHQQGQQQYAPQQQWNNQGQVHAPPQQY